MSEALNLQAGSAGLDVGCGLSACEQFAVRRVKLAVEDALDVVDNRHSKRPYLSGQCFEIMNEKASSEERADSSPAQHEAMMKPFARIVAHLVRVDKNDPSRTYAEPIDDLEAKITASVPGLVKGACAWIQEQGATPAIDCLSEGRLHRARLALERGNDQSLFNPLAIAIADLIADRIEREGYAACIDLLDRARERRLERGAVSAGKSEKMARAMATAAEPAERFTTKAGYKILCAQYDPKVKASRGGFQPFAAGQAPPHYAGVLSMVQSAVTGALALLQSSSPVLATWGHSELRDEARDICHELMHGPVEKKRIERLGMIVTHVIASGYASQGALAQTLLGAAECWVLAQHAVGGPRTKVEELVEALPRGPEAEAIKGQLQKLGREQRAKVEATTHLLLELELLEVWRAPA